MNFWVGLVLGLIVGFLGSAILTAWVMQDYDFVNGEFIERSNLSKNQRNERIEWIIEGIKQRVERRTNEINETDRQIKILIETLEKELKRSQK